MNHYDREVAQAFARIEGDTNPRADYMIESMRKAARKHFKQKDKQPRKSYISEEAWKLIDFRRKSWKYKNGIIDRKTSQQIEKTARKDKQRYELRQIEQ